MKFHTEKESIDFICDYFEKKGFTATPTQADNKYCHYDIVCTRGGKTLWLELKRRYCTSDHYGDAVIEKYKYESLKQGKSDNLTDAVILVNLFYDCFTLSDALSPIDFVVKQAAHTTEFSDDRIIDHTWARYNQDIKINYEKIPQQENRI